MEQRSTQASDQPGFELRERKVNTAAGSIRISYVACTALEDAGFTNAFSTRVGGVSSFPADALNLGYFKGDSDENVTENRRRFLEAIAATGSPVATLNRSPICSRRLTTANSSREMVRESVA